MHKLPVAFLPIIKADIEQRGMVHPIIIFSPYEQYQTDPNPVLPDQEKREERDTAGVHGTQKGVGSKRVRLLAHFCVPCTDGQAGPSVMRAYDD